MLYSQATQELMENTQQPVLVFLHGLLGCRGDWQQTIAHLSGYPVLCIDLPGHGLSAEIRCQDFKQCCDQISDTLLTQLDSQRPIVLIGYSMGGRIAMNGIVKKHFARLNIQQLIVEGGNFGLPTAEQRELRLANDSQWALRFTNEPIEQVLGDWYQQAVFSSLNHAQRQKLIVKRSANLGPQVAQMLLATSLAKQDYLLDALKSSTVPVHYICGEKDNKFSQLAERSGLSFSQIAEAGHNVHVEQPHAFAEIVKTQITRISQRVNK
ncbi:2-succinyl-6-hydroxy-2,4-cyclohexadiene-1-carboxylate synthase [Vibrio brasiliensis]|uniref:Putative 2-succinyl-6-hydroxy-2,4-cyclohexadiene-1-carboxylate synthase n=1 Tax=Vibrio brasiliensis LMG 20546 TaxID=945543 RepID=E8LQV9_9VIBR|nr:2-succinyl-6-hydroxy-2,4-cyclohexadiene-1-carboxylate synthase [Vibrio brasiliensis]EGA66885.1 2-succinyl-6-hydroxy-2,4-cyclohexadiene-1-carboxylate synthase [Vibrio brasiliensis LMG 20546]